ncbi:ABC transporter ATP-binding protein [Virgisporangium aliadipatigenens]|uniref:ABC transporter ATP-binding protein n=1 Tax=Virgisporangium aliadipatigenens TaxID=741659 RepID=A0A8J3YWM9_9ACTN|nr:ABC transporter ATP-binding protein [Virgisporangium aliadipatigenens]GIJ51195.1 ABC transporter ATP-binding protein [Virgisporangium aliadipatigenens]
MITIDEVTVRFGQVTALDAVSLTVAPHTVHAVIGPNGAGKSTLLNVLSGLYRPAHGTVRIDGTDLAGVKPYEIARLGVARSFQNVALSGGQTAMDSMLLGRHRLMRAGPWRTAFGTPGARREERAHRAAVAEIATRFGLDHLLERPVAQLAYGDRKRIDLARAMCAEPKVLLLDEPVAGLNAGETAAVSALIRRMRDEHDVTVVLVEHDMPMVMGLADEVTVLDFGRRIAGGTPAEIQDHPDVIRAYLGVAS